ncbi:MAG: hypothetical protein ACR2L6_03940 [Gemmatimonadaceae bacterium]
MTDNELEFTAEADPRGTEALRSHYAAPRDEAYWGELQSQVMARIAANARAGWLQVAAGWARPGLAAAAAVLVLAAALFQANRDEPESVTFAVMTRAEPSQPEFIYTEHDAASQRDETLRLVVSY